MTALLPRRLIMPPQDQVAGVLPYEARERLRAAYNTEPFFGPGESPRRTAAIERITRDVKAAYPHLFRETAVRTS